MNLELKEDKIREQLEVFYEKLPAPVAARLRKMNAEDETAFKDAAKEWSPSEDPEYWATRSCRKCYGRGYVGINHANQKKLYCSCTAKNYLVWLKMFRRFWNALREITLRDTGV